MENIKRPLYLRLWVWALVIAFIHLVLFGFFYDQISNRYLQGDSSTALIKVIDTIRFIDPIGTTVIYAYAIEWFNIKDNPKELIQNFLIFPLIALLIFFVDHSIYKRIRVKIYTQVIINIIFLFLIAQLTFYFMMIAYQTRL